MNPGVNHVGADMYAKHGNRKDAEAVADDGNRDNCQCDHQPVAITMKEQVPSHEAGNEQHEGGANTAAFLRYLDHDAREFEEEAVSQNRGLRNGKHERSGISRRVLKEGLDAGYDDFRERHHEQQKRQREREGAGSGGAKDPGRA